MNRSMPETPAVDLGPPFPPDHFVLRADHIKDFVRDIHRFHPSVHRVRAVSLANSRSPNLFKTETLMAKVDVDVVASILKETDIDPQVVAQIMRKLQQELKIQEEMAEATREPRVKNQYVVLLSDPLNQVPTDDLVAWVVQIPEMDSPANLTERISRAAHEYNNGRKGRKFPARSIGEACEIVASKFLKAERIQIKTKLPVSVIRTDNQLPQDKAGKISLSDLRGE